MKPRRAGFFAKSKTDDFIIKGLTGELNTSDSDLDIKDHQLSGGYNIIPISDTSLGKRDGTSLYGNFLGTGGVDGGFSFTGSNGTQEELVVWNGSLWRLVAGVWTQVTGVTLQATHPCEAVYSPDLDKLYIVNGLDNVVKYAAGSTSGDQTDAAFPKGKYIALYQGIFIVTGVTGFLEQVYYSTAFVDTFPAGFHFALSGEFDPVITGVLNYNNIMLMIFTKRRIFRLQNFVFDGTQTWASNLYELPSDFGAIYSRTIQIVNGRIYFLGQSLDSGTSAVAVYMTDGYTSVNISYGKIRGTTSLINAAGAETACAVSDSVYYRCFVPLTSFDSDQNLMGLVYDTAKNIFLTPEKKFVNNVAAPAMFWTAEHQGKVQVFFGTQNFGSVYQMHTNSGLSDELMDDINWIGSNDVAVDANPAKRFSTSFINNHYNATGFVPISKVVLFIKKNAGTTTDLVVRIETDSGNAPSGTLAGSNLTATIPAFATGTYSKFMIDFLTTNLLQGGQKYWIVVQHATEGAGNSQYYVLADTTGTNGFTNGSLSTYASGAWTTSAVGNSGVFVVFLAHMIQAAFVTKAYLPYDGRQFQMKRYEVFFSDLTAQATIMQLGLIDGAYNTVRNIALTLFNSGAAIFGTVANSGSGIIYGTTTNGGSGQIYGQIIRMLYFGSIDNYSDRIIKLSIGNDFPEQQFEFNQIMLVIAERKRNF